MTLEFDDRAESGVDEAAVAAVAAASDALCFRFSPLPLPVAASTPAPPAGRVC